MRDETRRGEEIAATLARLTARLPALPAFDRGDKATLDRAARELRALVKEASSTLRKLRYEPRVSTAPIESFRASCRHALAALRLHARAERRLESAMRKLDRCGVVSKGRIAGKSTPPAGDSRP